MLHIPFYQYAICTCSRKYNDNNYFKYFGPIEECLKAEEPNFVAGESWLLTVSTFYDSEVDEFFHLPSSLGLYSLSF